MATPKQKALIEAIEQTLTVHYTGQTVPEASAFITKHLPAYRKHGHPTDKQKALIQNIERALHVTYTGQSVTEASTFITKHLERYQEQAEELATAMYDAMCVGDH